VDRMEVQRRPEGVADHRHETIGPTQVLPLLGRDALRPCLTALVPLGLGAALASLLAPVGDNLLCRADDGVVTLTEIERSEASAVTDGLAMAAR
jgi:hypothetical protein